MTYDDAISIFKKHLQKLNWVSTDFEVWLSTSIVHVSEIFGIGSPQHTNITQIKNNYNLERITNKSRDLRDLYAYKAKQLIEDSIEYLEEKKRIAIKEEGLKNKATAQREKKLEQQISTLSSNYNSLYSEKQKLEEKLIQIRNQPKAKNIFFKAAKSVYQINAVLFWGVILPLLGGFFAFGLYVGTTKFDKNLIDLSDSNHVFKNEIGNLKDTVKARENSIDYMRRISDSALNILGHMPYKEMTLDTLSFRKVQNTIEDAGAALYLNKIYPK